MVSSNDHFFEWVQNHIGVAHIEKSNQEWNDYERKSGRFIASEDTNQIRQVRFGTLRPLQKKILKEVEKQNDRQIDVYLDPQGNHGKSWLAIHLWETGQAFVVPRGSIKPDKLSADICSGYSGQQYIIIDIPRASKIHPELYEELEEIKDGLVHDPRYGHHSRNIRGARIIVFTNNKLDTTKLSHDRWRLHGINGGHIPPNPPTKNAGAVPEHDS